MIKPDFRIIANQVVMPWAMRWRYRRAKNTDAPKIDHMSVGKLESIVAVALNDAYERGVKDVLLMYGHEPKNLHEK